MSFDVGDTIEGLPSRWSGVRELFLGHASSYVPVNIRPLGGGVPLLANYRRRAKLQWSGKLWTSVADQQNQLSDTPGSFFSLIGQILILDSAILLHILLIW